jgi:hypothetical protein
LYLWGVCLFEETVRRDCFDFLITLVSKKTFFSLPVKIQADYYSFDIAESEYDNHIGPSPTNLKGGGIIFKK